MMNITRIARTKGGQDGAIYGKYLFRLDSKGHCRVYDMELLTLSRTEPDEIQSIAEFTLDRADEIAPHSNAVVFGSEFYSDEDEFPLLYSNIYNNYAGAEDKKCGTCCVYRLQRNGESFTTTLVQLIQIGFTDDRSLWRSAGDTTTDVRPYGNFVIDVKNGIYYAFVMRDGDKTARYFSFDLPELSDGTADEEYGVRRVVLMPKDIRGYFDVPYHNYVQGACCFDGRIYSVEGFNEKIHPALRVIDPAVEKQIRFVDLCEAGYSIEAELIDFYDGRCIYSDAHGNYFELTFD